MDVFRLAWNLKSAFMASHCHRVGICIDEHRIGMTEVDLDPVTDSTQTCRVIVPTSCAGEEYVVTISTFDLWVRL